MPKASTATTQVPGVELDGQVTMPAISQGSVPVGPPVAEASAVPETPLQMTSSTHSDDDAAWRVVARKTRDKAKGVIGSVNAYSLL